VKTRSCDVLVAGGGPAGAAAAVAAARDGARVMLVEREAGLGGNVRAAKVHSICGLYRIASGGAPEPAQGGLAMELAERLRWRGGACGPQRFGRLDVVLQEPEIFTAVCAEWVAEERGVEVQCQAEVVSAEWGEHGVQSVGLRTREGVVAVRAGAFVEATGDANLTAAAGLPWEAAGGGALQRPAYIFGLAPVPAGALRAEARLACSALLAAAVRDGRLGPAALGAVVRPTCVENLVRVTLDWQAGGADYDPCDAAQVARLTREAADAAEVLADFLRREAPGFAAAGVCERPERIGIRESRRATGRHVITAEDVLGGVVPEDTVCRSAWPLEMHESGQAMRLVYPRADEPCGVPMRALRSAAADNVMLAGRCLSATHEAQAALRVIGTSLATGQAAGRAAAAVAGGREPDVAAIRRGCEP